MTLFDFIDKNSLFSLVLLYISFHGLVALIHGYRKDSK